MSTTLHRSLLALLILSALSACVFRHTVTPLAIDFRATPVQTRQARGDIKRLTYQNVTVEWGTNGIIENARRDGMSRVDFVDLEVLSILGIWTQTWVHVYGE